MRLAYLVVAMLLLPALARADVKRTVIEGRVVGPDHKPVGGATIIVSLDFADSGSSFAGEPSAADGSFKVELTPSSRLDLVHVFAYHRGFSNSLEARTVPLGSPGYKSPVLELRPTIAFTVTVTDAANAPVPSATVTIAKESFSTEHPLLGVPQPVDASGHVTFTGLNDHDSLELAVAAPGYLPVLWPTVELAKGALTIGIARGGKLTARLLDLATSAPVAGCTLISYAGTTTTDPTGGFELAAPYGTVVVWPHCDAYGTDHDHAPDGLAITFEEKAAGQRQTIKARRNHVVDVLVVDAHGKPVAGVGVSRTLVPKDPDAIRYTWGGPVVENVTTDPGGHAVFKGSSMDEFTLAVDGAPAPPRRLKFVDVRGQVTLVKP